MLPRVFPRKFPGQKRLTVFLIQIPILLLLFLGIVSLMKSLKKGGDGAVGALFTPITAPGTAPEAEKNAEESPVLRKARFIPPAKRPKPAGP